MPFFRITDLQRTRYEFANALNLQAGQSGYAQNLSGAMGSWSLVVWYQCVGSQVTISGDNSGAWLLGNRHTTANAWSLRMVTSSGNIETRLFGPGGNPALATIPTTDYLNRRHMAVIVRTPPTGGGNGRMMVSLDGAPLSASVEASGTAYDTWATVSGTNVGQLIGRNGLGQGQHFNTNYGELDLISAAITSDDVQRLWNGGRGSYWRDRGPLSAVSSLLRYKFDEPSGATAYDSSGSTPGTPRHLNLIGSPVFTPFI